MAQDSEVQENKFVRDVTNLIKSKATIITCQTGEWKRVQDGILDAIDKEVKEKGGTRRHFLKYNMVTRLSVWNWEDNSEEFGYWNNDDELIARYAERPWQQILETFANTIDQPFVMWFDDFHPKFNLKDTPEQIQLMEHVRQFARVYENNDHPLRNHVHSDRKTLIFSGENVDYVEELQHESTKVEMPLPTYHVLKRALEHVVHEESIPSKEVNYDKEFVEAALGLSVDQAIKAYRMAYTIHKNLNTSESRKEIIRNKKEIISQSGCLEYLEPEINIDDVGGLELLKEWLEVRRKSYSEAAQKRGLDRPKGILLTGVPGCGKSLTAKAVASNWGFPLVRFDVGAAFGSKVGQSEGNIRQALKVAEAASPCVLWIDEIEKALAGSGGSGDNDSGTTMRVFGTILTWLSEVKKPVFVVATANSIRKIPTELKRKGRWDEIFFVDLPDHASRKEIFEIQIRSREPDAIENIDLDALAMQSDSFTGAEIEAVVKAAQIFAFNDDRYPMEQSDIEEEIKTLVPMAQSMEEDIQKMRNEASEIGQKASVGDRGGIIPRRLNRRRQSFREN